MTKALVPENILSLAEDELSRIKAASYRQLTTFAYLTAGEHAFKLGLQNQDKWSELSESELVVQFIVV